MAKALFRFMRGELNGFYLQAINNALNSVSEETKQFFLDFYSLQFAEGKIDEKTLYNLGRFAGIYLPRVPLEELHTIVRMTESEYDEALHYEFSERGLYKVDDEDFEFEQKVIDDTGLPDINTLATETKRSSLVGDEAVTGYISEDEEDVLDEDGNVKPEAVLETPPEDKAYSDFYSNKFLFLAEGNINYRAIASEIFFPLFKAMQYIRYNGATTVALVKVVNTLCPSGLVKIDSVSVSNAGTSLIVNYTTDLTVEIDSKQDRIDMLLYVTRIKFPQIQMIESL